MGSELARQPSSTALSASAEPDEVAAAWLLSYAGHTRVAYRTDLRNWADWLKRFGLHPWTAQRVHVEAFARQLADDGLAPSTVGRRLSALASFYRYAVEEGVLERSPLGHVRRPRVDGDSQTLGLDRDELNVLLDIAEAHSPRAYALCCLLALNGLRISEALGADVEHLSTVRGHRTVTVTRKRSKEAIVPLAPRTAAALDSYLAGRGEGGAIFTTSTGQRLDRHGAAKLLGRLVRSAGIVKRISPHSLRHAFVTLALDAGASLRDVQDAAGHADPRTTRRYDRARQNLDRNPTYAVAAHLAQ